jgi:NAD(P)H-dependent FMN reductase
MVRVLGIAGSLRRGSFNRATLRAAQEQAPDVMIAAAQHKFDATGKLTDQATHGFIVAYLVAFEAWVLRIRRSGWGDPFRVDLTGVICLGRWA